MVSLHQQTKSIIKLDTSKPLVPLEKNQSALIYSKVAEKSEKWRMTSCSGKFITSLVATLQSSLLEQELEIQIYGKYFHVSLLSFLEIRAWVCFHSTALETCFQERKIKRNLISSPVAQQARCLFGHPTSACPCLQMGQGTSVCEVHVL